MDERCSIDVPGFGHSQPIPAACRIGDLLMSSLINGIDPATGKPAATIEAQCMHMFAQIRRIVEAAGGSVADIIKITVWMSDRAKREVLTEEWLKMFPDPQSRPARQTFTQQLSPGTLIQCDITAVLRGRDAPR